MYLTLMLCAGYNINWIAAQFKPKMLNRARWHLKNQEFVYFAPCWKETVKSGECVIGVECLLFAGYLCVRYDLDSVNISVLDSTNEVLRVVRVMGDRPGNISNVFYDGLKGAYNPRVFNVKSICQLM